jgi:hypothetical protein
MKATRYVMLTLFAGGTMVMAAACAKAPTDEIAAAEKALTVAREAEAATYAPEAWDRAEAAMTAATSEVAAQDARFALVRSYTKAHELLTSATTAAVAAEEAATAEHDRLRSEVGAMLAGINTDLDAAATMLDELAKCRRRPKGFAQDLELLQGRLQGLRDSVAPIELAAGDDRLVEAQSLGTTLSEEVAAFALELANAKTKLKCCRRQRLSARRRFGASGRCSAPSSLRAPLPATDMSRSTRPRCVRFSTARSRGCVRRGPTPRQRSSPCASAPRSPPL